MSILDSTLCIIESVMNDLRDSSSYAFNVKDKIRTLEYENNL